MEGAWHRRRWDIKTPFSTILLLMCMFSPTLTLLQPSEEQMCPHGDYLSEKGICCNKCAPGFKLVEECHALGQRSNCTKCPDDQYTDELNHSRNCRSCRRCKGRHDEVVSECQSDKNTICRCKFGFYKFIIDSETYDCRRCSECGQDEKKTHTCTPEKNTVCECKEGYNRVKGKCVPCKNCTAELTPPTWATIDFYEVPETGNGYLIIAGVAVMAVMLLVLLVLVTYIVTKWSTKNKLLKPFCQPSDVSVDSCERALFHIEEPSENGSVKAVPQSPVSEQEPYNLPDCVPLEVKIPDLIYTVLDLVPVLQVKQLVRSLGVKDTEIEQAELDHRSCREAHYQMLRVWAERGSRAGGGGRGRMLHSPLLQELLEELRKMHLGRAAEELETKYGIQ
ncbi:tumor necrosis factor receptor superfamily member 1A isoform X2 [Etheostoma spectabile]|uniref:tumor necrosis factor receptor superfamily member 1A isoform X2 n=1 Tax=Etheostoma spectabile TaxID=54343 RepID=UPI0013AFCFAB|nr:tumor necrosis factor receptor superfamily member 1A isoform X2 [Etheostoma spectabile]